MEQSNKRRFNLFDQSTLPLVLIGLTVAMLAVWQIYQLNRSAVLSSLRQTGEERLNLYAGTLRGALEKYSYLPFILAKNQDIQDVLQERDYRDLVNRYLYAINKQAGAAVLFVMDKTGTTICSSNWQEQLSFVGKNYGFRPYFKDAMRGRSTGFFAIGVTTGLPGYFMSSPIYGPTLDEVIGVAVVKVDLAPLQNSWLEGGEIVLVGDKNGIIFLSSTAQYKYRSFETLTGETVARIRTEKQYHGIDIQLLHFKSLPIFAKDAISIAGAGYLLGSRKLTGLDWRIYYLSPLAEARSRIYGTVIIAAVTAFFLLVLLLYFRERRFKRISNRKARAAETLRRINERLQLEIKEHNRTDQELRDTQQEVIQAGKLAALGQMSAAISHELNQPIAAIRTYAASSRKLFEQGREQMVLQNMDIISDLTEHMGSITSQLKTFARKSEGIIEPVNLQDRITRVRFLLETQISLAGVGVNMDLCKPQMVVAADPVRIDQVLVNLIRNGIDAMKESKEKQLGIFLTPQGEHVELKISDSGHGIEEQYRDHLFEPFFTTKDVGDGVGLGLSISYGIITDLGGTIRMENNGDGGTSFIIRLAQMTQEKQAQMQE